MEIWHFSSFFPSHALVHHHFRQVMDSLKRKVATSVAVCHGAANSWGCSWGWKKMVHMG
jgi:hypothetical protein